MKPLHIAACIAASFSAGFLISELASASHAHAQSNLQIHVQSVGDPNEHKPINLQGSKVIGFSCANGTCYVATQ
jgi:hypothetical protein